MWQILDDSQYRRLKRYRAESLQSHCSGTNQKRAKETKVRIQGHTYVNFHNSRFLHQNMTVSPTKKLFCIEFKIVLCWKNNISFFVLLKQNPHKRVKVELSPNVTRSMVPGLFGYGGLRISITQTSSCKGSSVILPLLGQNHHPTTKIHQLRKKA